MDSVRYTGAVTTSGNSEAIRFEKSLFRAHPEFKRKRNVTAVVIAPGQMLISLSDELATSPDEDPVFDAFLAFLGDDMERHPERLQLLSSGSLVRAGQLTDGITVSDDEVFPDDFTV
jgi:antitoxin PrlF